MDRRLGDGQAAMPWPDKWMPSDGEEIETTKPRVPLAAELVSVLFRQPADSEPRGATCVRSWVRIQECSMATTIQAIKVIVKVGSI